jgi:hypothetical protein
MRAKNVECVDAGGSPGWQAGFWHCATIAPERVMKKPMGEKSFTVTRR